MEATTTKTQNREIALEIKSVSTATLTFELLPDQYFCKTNKAYEIWQKTPLLRIKRIDRKRVLWVEEN